MSHQQEEVCTFNSSLQDNASNVSGPQSPQREQIVLDMIADRYEEINPYGSNDMNLKAERRANKLVKRYAKFSLPEADLKIRNKLRELQKCLTIEQKEDLEKKKEKYLSHLSLTEADTDSKIIHKEVRCEGCSKMPIIGLRYKCSQCPNFNYCEECEAKFSHPHAFVQMKKPEQKYLNSSLEVPSSSTVTLSNKKKQIGRKRKQFLDNSISLTDTFDDDDDDDDHSDEDQQRDDDSSLIYKNQPKDVSKAIQEIYASEINEKAKKLSELFPEKPSTEVYEFVSKAHHLSLEALVDKWLLA